MSSIKHPTTLLLLLLTLLVGMLATTYSIRELQTDVDQAEITMQAARRQQEETRRAFDEYMEGMHT